MLFMMGTSFFRFTFRAPRAFERVSIGRRQRWQQTFDFGVMFLARQHKQRLDGWW